MIILMILPEYTVGRREETELESTEMDCRRDKAQSGTKEEHEGLRNGGTGKERKTFIPFFPASF
jgi:hypothetical protein